MKKNNKKIKTIKKDNNFFLFPTIILIARQNYGAVATIKGKMFCFGHWVVKIGRVTLEREAFTHPVNITKLASYYKQVYKENVEKETVDHILRNNVVYKDFFKRTEMDYHYAKKLLAKIVYNNLHNYKS